MRLKQNELRKAYLFREQAVESEYLGSVQGYVYTDSILCNVQAVKSELAERMYGERVKSGFQMICNKDCGIEGDTAVSLFDCNHPTHRAVSIMEYSDHLCVLVEKID